MRPWNEIIAEARDRNKEKAERERRLRIARTHLKGSAALGKGGKTKKEKYGPGDPHFDLARDRENRKTKQLEFSIDQSKKNAEEKKKKQLEDLKDKPRQAASAALSGIKSQSISYRDSDATAYTKAIGNAASLAGGVTKAVIQHQVAKHKAKKAAAEAEKSDGASKIPEKKPKKSGPLGGRPPGGGPNPPGGGPNPPGGGPNPPGGGPNPPGGGPNPPGGGPNPPGGLSIKPRKKLIPLNKRLPPAKLKMLPPSGGTQPSSRGKSLGQQARENPELKKKMISQRNQTEEYSNWREEFIFEVEDKTDKPNKKKKEKIIDVMSGQNKVEINPNMKEEKDQEGGMAHNELATMERAVKTLRKKIKSPNQQLPAWVQSKISKAADHIDTVADYMSGETEPVSEGYDEGDETFRQHSRETFASPTPSERRNRTAGVLKLMKQVNADVEKPKKKKKKKTVAEECGCEDDKKKVLMMAILKKVIDAKKKKNFQLNSGIIGESSPAWQRKEGKNPEGGLNKAGIASYRRENPGSKLSLAVTTPPSKLDPDSKSAKRRKSFCARMGGMPGAMKDEKGRPTRKALSLRKWNC
jgi:hypothetical protein